MKKEIIEALTKHAEGQIAKHVANVQVYMSNPAGVGEHSNILETVEGELCSIAKYHDQLEILQTYFTEGDE